MVDENYEDKKILEDIFLESLELADPVKKLEKMNLNIFRFIFDDLGLQTWKTREE